MTKRKVSLPRKRRLTAKSRSARELKSAWQNFWGHFKH